MCVSRRPGDNGRKQVSQQAQEKRHVLGDELGEVHVSQRFHEQEIFVLVQVVALGFPGRPMNVSCDEHVENWGIK